MRDAGRPAFPENANGCAGQLRNRSSGHGELLLIRGTAPPTRICPSQALPVAELNQTATPVRPPDDWQTRVADARMTLLGPYSAGLTSLSRSFFDWRVI